MPRRRGVKRQRRWWWRRVGIAQFRMQLQSHVARLKTGFLLRIFIFSRNKYLHTANGRPATAVSSPDKIKFQFYFDAKECRYMYVLVFSMHNRQIHDS